MFQFDFHVDRMDRNILRLKLALNRMVFHGIQGQPFKSPAPVKHNNGMGARNLFRVHARGQLGNTKIYNSTISACGNSILVYLMIC